MTPFERFVNRTTTGGLLLMTTAAVALLLANTPLAGWYQNLLHTDFGLQFGPWHIEKTLHHWVNDGLMTLFFFLVGLELKREILVGELAEVRKALLPIVAAVGGMIVPALCYVALNYGSGDTLRGWGIPMATDIAFALGVIALLASRVPKALITFLVALAIVDDLGAVVVIALFYTDQLVWQFLIAAGFMTGILVLLNIVGIRTAAVYFVVGSLLWLVLLKSGVHATLAGVITAFAIPAKPKFDPELFTFRVKQLLQKFEHSYTHSADILKNPTMNGIVHTLESGVQGVQPPLQRLVHSLHKPVAFMVLPIFALFNAGVTIDFANTSEIISHPVTLGVITGLIFGKFIGIAGASWLAIRLGWSVLPTDTTMRHIIGASMLGSIGFTMSIFIAELAFSHQPDMVVHAKLGILFASLIAGVCGYLWLLRIGGEKSAIGSVYELKR
nr:Na+/H+ antiporter NhaA [Neiella litorisoli]